MGKRASKPDLWMSFVIPAVFVLLWSTGWIVARFAANDADVLTFLLLRYAGAASVLAIYAALSGAQWPKTRADWGHAMISGVLLHAFYLGGVWWAISHGVPASISALLAALQPILTAILAPWLAGERIRPLQWIGIGLGFSGLVLVLAPKLSSLDSASLSAAILPLGINVCGMISLTLGTFYQKRYVRSGDLRTVSVLQFVSSLLVTLPLAFAFEDMRVGFSLNTALSLVWSIGAISIVSMALLLQLIRRGEVARSAQLIYLVPAAAAIQAVIFFGEQLEPMQIAGMIVTSLGVALAVRR